MSDDTTKFQYPFPHTEWQQIEFHSTFLTALTLALLTTLISYQLTAVATDIVLGWKPRNVAPIHAFQSLLLSRKSSPIAILNALFRTDALTRFYFQGNLPARSVITRDQESVKPNAVFLLLTLLFTAPLVNVLAIVMTIEEERHVTIAEARFPKVSFGIRDNGSTQVRLERFTEVCGMVPIDFHPQDTPLSRFVVCTNILGPRISNFTNRDRREGSISILANQNISVKVQVEVGESFIEGHVFGQLRTPSENWRVRMNVTKADAEIFVQRGVELIKEECGSNQTLSELFRDEKGQFVPLTEEFLVGYGNITCPPNGKSQEEEDESMFQILRGLIDEFLTLKNATSLDVSRGTGTSNSVGSFRDGSSEPFVNRRTRFVGIPVMAIVAGIAVIARMAVAVFLNNDVNDGIERILKERVGVPHYASLLQEGETVVSYNAPRGDATGGRLNPLRSYGAGSSFLPSLSAKRPSTSQRTLVMFEGLPHGSTDGNQPELRNTKGPELDTDPDLI